MNISTSISFQGYLNFLVDHRDELGVTLDNISSLFGCIERIYAFNRKLLQQLDMADLDCVKVRKSSIHESGWILGQHRSNFPKITTPPATVPFVFQNMLKHLPSSLPPEDLAVVKRAHEVMTSQASRINDEKKRAEHAERVEQLQAAIQKWTVDKVRYVLHHMCKFQQTANLSAYGELLLEAQFRQAGSKTTRLLFLFEEMLLIVKQRNSNYICKDYIMASSADQKRTWMIELKRMMLDHYGIEIPEKTKQLMLSMDNTQRVAFGRPEFAEVSMKNHKRVPKYLEKRRKSVDKGATDNNRRRSLSASRLLGASKDRVANQALL
ncbi:hypothetical protein ANCCEY_13795 [Ancylostoma ceylanicum]|uniref:PH domain-containing protein n=1 Tax=Ancylostoma ceylanicum TaxID=53326 RepID=A0A0D6L6P9_9BILA|nr:hypothetical protein ANCCEY_13795 [Ancylostoma ceylanicum]